MSQPPVSTNPNLICSPQFLWHKLSMFRSTLSKLPPMVLKTQKTTKTCNMAPLMKKQTKSPLKPRLKSVITQKTRKEITMSGPHCCTIKTKQLWSWKNSRTLVDVTTLPTSTVSVCTSKVWRIVRRSRVSWRSRIRRIELKQIISFMSTSTRQKWTKWTRYRKGKSMEVKLTCSIDRYQRLNGRCNWQIKPWQYGYRRNAFGSWHKRRTKIRKNDMSGAKTAKVVTKEKYKRQRKKWRMRSWIFEQGRLL